MATFAEEKMLRAHLELIAEGGDYAAYFTQGTNEDGEPSAWFLADDANQAAAQALLDAKVAELSNIGSESAGGEGPSNWDGYTAIHFSNDVVGANYRAWFVDTDGDYWKADNGNSDTLVQITDSAEIDTLLSDSGFIPDAE